MDDILSYKRDENYYHLLGCDQLSNTQQILKEYKKIVLRYHPDKNSDPEAGKLFKKIQRAKEVLTCEEKRRVYDKWLNSGISMNFEQWLNLSANVQTSMHWRNVRKNDPMLKSGHDEDTFIWERDSIENETLKKFRNYEI